MCTPTTLDVPLGDTLMPGSCDILFAFVKNGVNTQGEEIFFSACKNNLLRMDNVLLRRLPQSQNIVFCRNIQPFIAKFFPFFE
jgi:THO complex subunit 1